MPKHNQFTPALVDAIVPQGQEIHSAGNMPGLQVVASHTGSRYFAVQYRHAGKVNRLKLFDIGTECTYAKIETAWADAQRLRNFASQGIDPRDVLKEERAAATRLPKVITVEEAWNDYSTSGRFRSLRPSSQRLYRITYNKHLAHLGPRLLVSLTPKDVASLYDEITNGRQEFHTLARTVMVILKNIWSHADRRELIAADLPNPTRHLSKEAPGWAANRQKLIDLPDEFLRAFWELTYSLDSGGRHHPTGSLVRFALLTGLRHSNLTRLLWEYVSPDFRTLKIPAASMKAKRDLVIPLTSLARAELIHLKFPPDTLPWAADGRFVFGRITASTHRLAQELFGEVEKPRYRKRQLLFGDLPAPDPNRTIAKWGAKVGVPHRLTCHGLRKTFARWTEREGDYLLASYLLHHAPPKHVTSAYLVQDLSVTAQRAEAIALKLRAFLGSSYRTVEPQTSYFRMWRDVKRDKVFGEVPDDDVE